MLLRSLSMALCASNLFLATACTIGTGGINIEYSSKTLQQSMNFVEAAPTYHIYKIEVAIDTSYGEDYNSVDIKHVPATRVSIMSDQELVLDLPPSENRQVIVQQVPETSKGSVKAFVASEKELNSEELIDLSARALKYRGQSVQYNGRRSKIPACSGMLTGFKYRTTEKTGRASSVEMLANISEAGQGVCLVKAEVVVPSKGTFTLVVNGDTIVRPRMSGKRRYKSILDHESALVSDKMRDQFSRMAMGIDGVLRRL